MINVEVVVVAVTSAAVVTVIVVIIVAVEEVVVVVVIVAVVVVVTATIVAVVVVVAVEVVIIALLPTHNILMKRLVQNVLYPSFIQEQQKELTEQNPIRQASLLYIKAANLENCLSADPSMKLGRPSSRCRIFTTTPKRYNRNPSSLVLPIILS